VVRKSCDTLKQSLHVEQRSNYRNLGLETVKYIPARLLWQGKIAAFLPAEYRAFEQAHVVHRNAR
jgi:hypothetical protein